MHYSLVITDWERCQFILLHVEFGQVISPGKNSVRDAVAEVVLHVQVLQKSNPFCSARQQMRLRKRLQAYRGVDELRRSPRREARELVPRERDVREVLERAEEAVRQIGDEVVLHVELLERGAVGERAGNGIRLWTVVESIFSYFLPNFPRELCGKLRNYAQKQKGMSENVQKITKQSCRRL